MAQIRQHLNARLTPRQRREMVAVVLEQGWSVAAAAERFQVDPKTARKWRDRSLAEGADGLVDRSSRPHTSPARPPEAIRRRVVELRTSRRRLALPRRRVGGVGSARGQRKWKLDADRWITLARNVPPSSGGRLSYPVESFNQEPR